MKYVQIAVVLALCLLIPACKSKVNKANFDMIKEGMTLAEVEKILGKGTKETGDGSNVAGQFGVVVSSTPTSGGGDFYTWETNTSKITIGVRDGKVANKRAVGF